jgi:hypothetical protein
MRFFSIPSKGGQEAKFSVFFYFLFFTFNSNLPLTSPLPLNNSIFSIRNVAFYFTDTITAVYNQNVIHHLQFRLQNAFGLEYRILICGQETSISCVAIAPIAL